MAEQEKTHFRKAFHSPYLSSADIVEPIILTVARVALEKDATKKTQDFFNTCYWKEKFIRKGEPMKPMILNATNSKFMAGYTGSKFIDDWGGAVVCVYVDPDVRFGRDTVEGLRLRAAEAPPETPPKLLAEAEAQVSKGAVAFARWWNALKEQRKLFTMEQRDEMLARAKQVTVNESAPAIAPAPATVDPAKQEFVDADEPPF